MDLMEMSSSAREGVWGFAPMRDEFKRCWVEFFKVGIKFSMVICTAKMFLAKSACSSPSNRVLWFRGNYLFSFTTSILKDLETLTPMLGSVELQSLIASKGTLSFPGNWRYPVFWFHLPNGMVVTVASKTPRAYLDKFKNWRKRQPEHEQNKDWSWESIVCQHGYIIHEPRPSQSMTR